MRKVAVILFLFLIGTYARAQTGTIVLSVTSGGEAITVNQNCNYVVIQENSASPSNAFTITLPGQATGITYAAGTKFIFASGGAGYKSGQTLGTISVASGTVAFIGIESISTPTVPAKSGNGQIVFQNAGSPLGSAATFNCSTNTSCSLAGGIVTITASQGGSGCTLQGGTGNLLYDTGSACDDISKWTTNGTTTITGAATGIFDASAISTFKLPVSSGCTSSANGTICYDSNATAWHIWQNGHDYYSIASTNIGTSGQVAESNADGSYSFGDPIVSGPTAIGSAPSATNPVFTCGWDGTDIRCPIVTNTTPGASDYALEVRPVGTVPVSGTFYPYSLGQQVAGSSVPVILPSATITTLTPPTAAAVGTSVSGDLLIGTQVAGSSVPVALPTATITTLTPPTAAAIASAIVSNPPTVPVTVAVNNNMTGTSAGTAPSYTGIVGGKYNSSAPSPTNGQTVPLQLDSSGNLNVNVKAGGGSGGTSSTYGATFPSTGTAVGATDGTNMQPLTVDGSGYLKVNVAAGSSGNAAASATGSSVPADASYDGINVSGTLRGQTGVNPTGSVYAAQQDLSSVGGSSIALGSAVSASSIPVVIASDQASVAVKQATAANLNATVVPGSGVFEVGPTGSANTLSNQFFTQVSDGTHGVSTNSSSYTSHYGFDVNLLGLDGAVLSATNPLFGEVTDGTHAMGAMTAFGSTPSTAYALNANASLFLGTVAAATGNGVSGTGTQRVNISSDNTVLPAVGAGATGSTVPANASYQGGNGSGTTVGYLNCDHSVAGNDSTSGETELVAQSSGKTIYVCGFQLSTSQTTAVTATIEYSASNSCTSMTAITPGYPLQAATSTGPIGLVIMTPGYTGLNTGSGNTLCLNLSGAYATQYLVFYTVF